ncbi:hypothetical protein C5167_002691 [Papaver somniferum]|uniref:Uncharacterized protein n=1 Tax=Papaver somniferum TaxID=3469 RepID=A0A4Y7KYU9_PAPSO|nr:hypothetical protein C5167_002691 [Papaver somniferum]
MNRYRDEHSKFVPYPSFVDWFAVVRRLLLRLFLWDVKGGTVVPMILGNCQDYRGWCSLEGGRCRVWASSISSALEPSDLRCPREKCGSTPFQSISRAFHRGILRIMWDDKCFRRNTNGNLKAVSLQDSRITSTFLVAVVVGLFEYAEYHRPDGIIVYKIYILVAKSRVRSVIENGNQEP